MQCPNCKNPLKEDAAFCGYCGTRVPRPAPAPQPNLVIMQQPPVQPQPVVQQMPVQVQPAPQPTKESGTQKVWLLSILLSLVLVLLLAVGGFAYLVVNEKIDLSDTFLAFFVKEKDDGDSVSYDEPDVKTYEDDEFAILDEEEDLIIDSDDVKSATVTRMEDSDVVGIMLELNDEGRAKFASSTKENIGKKIEIYVDHELVSITGVSQEITNGKFMLTCEDDETAEEYCEIINDCIS